MGRGGGCLKGCHRGGKDPAPGSYYSTEDTAQIGHPTVLVNNAGVVQGKLLLDLTPADIKQCVLPSGCVHRLMFCNLEHSKSTPWPISGH